MKARTLIGLGVYGTIHRRSREHIVEKRFSIFMAQEWRILLQVKDSTLCGGEGIQASDEALAEGALPVVVTMRRYYGDFHDVSVPLHDAPLYLRQAMEGLDYLHGRAILHLDIAPTNLFLDISEKKLVLADFGLSLQMPKGATRVFSCVKRCSIPSPEAGPRRRPFGCPSIGLDAGSLEGYVYEPATDLYSLGKSFEQRFGYRLHKKKTPTPADFGLLLSVLRLTHPDPAKRSRLLVAESNFDAVREEIERQAREAPPVEPVSEHDTLSPRPIFSDTAEEEAIGDVFAGIATRHKQGAKLLLTLKNFCAYLTRLRGDTSATVLVVLLDLLLRVPFDRRVICFMARAYLAMAYVYQEYVDYELMDGLTPSDVGSALLQCGGIIYDPKHAYVTSTDTAKLRRVIAAVVNGSPVQTAPPSEDPLPGFNVRLCSLIRPIRATKNAELVFSDVK